MIIFLLNVTFIHTNLSLFTGDFSSFWPQKLNNFSQWISSSTNKVKLLPSIIGYLNNSRIVEDDVDEDTVVILIPNN